MQERHVEVEDTKRRYTLVCWCVSHLTHDVSVSPAYVAFQRLSIVSARCCLSRVAGGLGAKACDSAWYRQCPSPGILCSCSAIASVGVVRCCVWRPAVVCSGDCVVRSICMLGIVCW